MALLSSLNGLGCFLSTDFPSVKTLGYFQETQTLNRYARRPYQERLWSLLAKVPVRQGARLRILSELNVLHSRGSKISRISDLPNYRLATQSNF